MFHCSKKATSPITLEELKRMGKEVHGRSIWSEEGRLYLFDEPTGRLLEPQELEELQSEHARRRRANYPGGRRRGHKEGRKESRDPYAGMGWASTAHL